MSVSRRIKYRGGVRVVHVGTILWMLFAAYVSVKAPGVFRPADPDSLAMFLTWAALLPFVVLTALGRPQCRKAGILGFLVVIAILIWAAWTMLLLADDLYQAGEQFRGSSGEADPILGDPFAAGARRLLWYAAAAILAIIFAAGCLLYVIRSPRFLPPAETSVADTFGPRPSPAIERFVTKNSPR